MGGSAYSSSNHTYKVCKKLVKISEELVFFSVWIHGIDFVKQKTYFHEVYFRVHWIIRSYRKQCMRSICTYVLLFHVENPIVIQRTIFW